MIRPPALRLPTLLAALALSAGCSAWPPANGSPEAPELAGWTRFPAYRVQADFAEVAAAASVSLIDPAASRTLATSLTDAGGRFRLSFLGFRPARQVYFLEAIKGLHANAVGRDAVRIRTLISWDGSSWTSLTSAAPGLVALDASTTALCVIQSLRGTGSVDPASLIGSVQVGEHQPFTPGASGVTLAEFDQARSLVLEALLNDVDPMDAVIASNGGYAIKPGLLNQAPVLFSGVRPRSASVGMTVTLLGEGFAAIPAASTVSFSPDRFAPVLAASASALTVRVPAGATSGTVTLETNGVTSSASFVVLPLVNGSLTP